MQQRRVVRLAAVALADGDDAERLAVRRPQDEVADELEATAVVRDLIATDPSVPPPDRGPLLFRLLMRAVWPVLLPSLARFRRFVTIGLMPP